MKFRMMLGLQLGRLPSELSETMLAAEEATFMAYYREDPWGDHRADIRSAQIVKKLHDINRGKGSSERKLTDFLLFWKKPPAPEDPDISKTVRSTFAKLMSKK